MVMRSISHVTGMVVFCASLGLIVDGDAAEALSLKIVVPPNTHPRVLYGVEQLRALIARHRGRAEIVTRQETALQPNTIVVGTAADGPLFKRALTAAAQAPEGSSLVCRPNASVLIAGVDESGVLYGCLELAERIEALAGRLPSELSFSDAPKLRLRGPCIGLQRPEIIYDRVMYDYRYLPKTFPWFYDKKLWTRYLDLLARHRFNTLYLWNGHPFTSILRLPKYPEAQEVDTPQLGANIELFNWLCTEADRRGIWVVQFFYNIHVSHTFARHHKIGICHSKPTPLVSEYTSYCISEFIKSYPHVGLMMCLGENLNDRYDAEWLSDVIIPAVKAGLKPGQPLPPIIVRAHSTPIFDVLEKGAPLYDNIYTMGKYTSETLTSDQVGGGPGHGYWENRRKLAEKFLLIINVHCVCNLEPFRWGSPAFVRRAIDSCLKTGIKGLHLYPLRYWDWPNTADRAEPRLLQPDRDWLWFATWARYAWNPYRNEEAENAFWTRELAGRFGSTEAGRRILAAYEHSGEVMPHIVRAFADQAWNVEAHTLGQTMQQFFNSPRWFAPPGESVSTYAAREASGLPHEGETPPAAGEAIVQEAQAAVREAEAAAQFVTASKDEFSRLLSDFRAIRLIARFYAHRSAAAVAGLLFLRKRDLAQLESCESLLTKSVEDYRELASLTATTHTDCVSRHDSGRRIPYPAPKYLVWSDVLPELEKELDVLRSNAAFIRQHKSMWTEAPPYPPVAIAAKSKGQSTYRVTIGAKMYTDRDYVIESVPNEVIGLTSIRFPNSMAKRNPCPISFAAEEPVKVFVAFGKRQWSWAEPPKGWTLYAPGAFKMHLRTCDIYFRDFPTGESTIQFEKGTFVILGFTKIDVKLRPEASRFLDQKLFTERLAE